MQHDNPVHSLGSDTMDGGLQVDWIERRVQRRDQSGLGSVLDLEHLRTFTGGSVAFEREVVGLFAGELPRTFAALERATTPRDWHMAAHTLKGSALGIGAFKLAAAARVAESLVTQEHRDRDAAVATLRTAIADVLAEAQRLHLI